MYLKRKNYEESMMIRLNMTREQKQRKRRLMGMSSQLNNIAQFGDITALTGGEVQVSWIGTIMHVFWGFYVIVTIYTCIYVIE